MTDFLETLTQRHGKQEVLIRSGLNFNLLSPGESDFTIHDIAHSLANICRFNGHTRHFYSVAQHSVLVSQILPADLQFAGLMHDAAEAFIGDFTPHLKRLFPDLKRLEEEIEKAIFKRFGIPFPLPPEIKKADLTLLATERRDLMPACNDVWEELAGISPTKDFISPCGPSMAKRIFLNRFEDLASGI